ncbi:MAG: hypothetical protein ACI4F2_06390 [Acutalibacteraceae bacterium]
MDFLQMLGIIADCFGIISLFLGIVTLKMTLGIKESLLRHIEKSDYLRDIDNQIKELISFRETLLKDRLYNQELLERIDAQLDEIYISYETILPKKLLGEISRLRKHIVEKCLCDLSNNEYKRKCTRDLHTIYTNLKKEKKIL